MATRKKDPVEPRFDEHDPVIVENNGRRFCTICGEDH